MTRRHEHFQALDTAFAAAMSAQTFFSVDTDDFEDAAARLEFMRDESMGGFEFSDEQVTEAVHDMHRAVAEAMQVMF